MTHEFDSNDTDSHLKCPGGVNNIPSGIISTRLITVPPASPPQDGDENSQNTNNLSLRKIQVQLPDGSQKETVIQLPLQKKTLYKHLIRFLRELGYEGDMEAILPEGIWPLNEDDNDTFPIQIIFANDQRKISEVEIDDRKSGSATEEDQPLYISGKLALCDYCGFLSQDFARCQRCYKKFNNKVRQVDDMRTRASCKSNNSRDKNSKGSMSDTQDDEDTEVFSVSSDEESGKVSSNCKKSKNYSKDSKSQLTSSDPEMKRSSVIDKEPIITEETEGTDQSPYPVLAGGGKDLNDLIDSPEVENCLLECRSVRIGSYKVVPLECVLLSAYGLKIRVDSLKKEPTTIKILRNEVVKVLVNFGSDLPVMFYYITSEAGRKVRNALHMSQKDPNLYFDPTSPEEVHKRITLLPVDICEESRLFIKSIYESNGLLMELDSSDANDILVRAAKKDNPNSKMQKSPSSMVIETIMVYPPPPFKGGLSINTEDYACLGEDQFLNDVIIDFYLQYMLLNMLSEEDRKRTFILSSFFYTRLTLKMVDSSPLSPAEKRHARVKGWTKGVNIFEKDFILIPINENSHWILAIICFPGLVGCAKIADNKPLPNDTGRRGRNRKMEENGKMPSMIGETTITVVSASSCSQTAITLEPDADDEKDEADANEDDIEPNSSEDEENSHGDLLDEEFPRPTPKPSSSNSKPIPNLDAIKQPCILLFDSLQGASRCRIVATLREYLTVEYKAKHKGASREFSKTTIKGAVPRVPQQNNFTDCGLFLLQYAEEFFKNPIPDFRMPLKLEDWFPPEIVATKRYDIQQILHRLMDELGVDREQLNLPNLDLRPEGTGSSIAGSVTEGRRYSEEADEDAEHDHDDDDEMLPEDEMGAEEEEEDELMDEEEEEDYEEMESQIQIRNNAMMGGAVQVLQSLQKSTSVSLRPAGVLNMNPQVNNALVTMKSQQQRQIQTSPSPSPLPQQPKNVVISRSHVNTQIRGSPRVATPSPRNPPSGTPRATVRPITLEQRQITPGTPQPPAMKRTVVNLNTSDASGILRKKQVLQGASAPRTPNVNKQSPLSRISSSVEITKKKVHQDSSH